MSEAAEWFTTYLQYDLKDMLSVILYTSQSFMSITPLLYYITYQKKRNPIYSYRNSWRYCSSLLHHSGKTSKEVY